MVVKSYKDLQVWEAGIELSIEVYKATQSFPKRELFGLVSQTQRAATSIPANIAEGSGRQHTGELLQFLHIARGSLNELQTHITIASRLGYLTAATSRSLEEKIDAVGRMLHGLIASLKAKRRAPITNHKPLATNHSQSVRDTERNTDMAIHTQKTYNYTIVETACGWVAVAGRDGKISAIEMPQPTREQALAKLSAGIEGKLVESNDGFGTVARQIKSYFAGESTAFDFEPDLEHLTEFQRKVLRTTMTVPYGSIVSYRWIAEKAGHPGAYRAAGQALGRNPIPVAIPCHRVVAEGGKLGGFSGGLHWKEKLLSMEGVSL